MEWSKKVKEDLEELNVWKVIEEAPIETIESIENVDMRTAIKTLRQFRENWMALILINQTCGFPINLHIVNLHSARAAWEILATNLEQGPEVERFLSAGERGDWKTVEACLDSNHKLAEARIPFSQNTILHLASLAGEVKIVKKLVRFMTEEDLEIQDNDGYTALAKASINGDKRIAQCMIQKNMRLVSILTGTKLLPVVIAMMYGKKEMALYLYSVMPPEDLTNKGNSNGATVLTHSIRWQYYDISVDLIQKYPHLVVALDHNRQSALYQLVCTPFAFHSGSQLRIWQRLIYNCVLVQDNDWDMDTTRQSRLNVQDEDISRSILDTNDIRLSVQDEDVNQSNLWKARCRGIWQQIASRLLAVLGIKGIYEMKLVHHQSRRLLHFICEQIKEDDLDDHVINDIINALHEAASRGVVEFVVEVLKKFPEFRWFRDKEGSTIFMKAVQFRQADVFDLIHEFPSKDKMVVLVDKFGENILHKLKHCSVHKTSIFHELTKLREELKWFEEIKGMMPPDSLEIQNHEKKTAQELIDENHKQLMSDTEEGLKRIVDSCLIVGILVVTIMFAAALTVPGGNDQDTGLPILIKKKLFKVFIISDALSLFSSTISVIIFLGIQISRYAGIKDFLEYLSRSMVAALLMLFFSVIAMAVASAAIFLLMVRTDFWTSIPPIYLLALLPAIIFQLLFFNYVLSPFMHFTDQASLIRKVNCCQLGN